MKKLMVVIAFALAVLALFVNCKHNSDGLEALPEVCFEREVLPIYQSNCAISGCHTSGGGESGYSFNSYAGIMQGVTPNNPDKSPAYTATTSIWGIMMPPKGYNQLTEEQRTLIYVWIQQDALNTKCPN